MIFRKLDLDNCFLVESDVHHDARGFFRESFNSDAFESENGKEFQVFQHNVSWNKRGSLRGIHYSLSSNGQQKYLTCVSGSIVDVIVNLDVKSRHFLKHLTIPLNAGDGRSIYIGRNIGHAFLALEENTVVTYLIDTTYDPNNEQTIDPFDKSINICWESFGVQENEFILSDRDAKAPSLNRQMHLNKLPKSKF